MGAPAFIFSRFYARDAPNTRCRTLTVHQAVDPTSRRLPAARKRGAPFSFSAAVWRRRKRCQAAIKLRPILSSPPPPHLQADEGKRTFPPPLLFEKCYPQTKRVHVPNSCTCVCLFVCLFIYLFIPDIWPSPPHGAQGTQIPSCHSIRQPSLLRMSDKAPRPRLVTLRNPVPRILTNLK